MDCHSFQSSGQLLDDLLGVVRDARIVAVLSEEPERKRGGAGVVRGSAHFSMFADGVAQGLWRWCEPVGGFEQAGGLGVISGGARSQGLIVGSSGLTALLGRGGRRLRSGRASGQDPGNGGSKQQSRR